MVEKWKLTTDDKNKIVNDYVAGTPILQIARLYHIDHSTVYYHLKRARVFVNGKPHITTKIRQVIYFKPKEKKKKEVIRDSVMRDFDGEPINQGHDYSWYLECQKKKKFAILKKGI